MSTHVSTCIIFSSDKKDADRHCNCDGFHTFDELYEHRNRLFIELCSFLVLIGRNSVWAAKAHSDGTMYEGYFVMGINTSAGSQITYHLPIKFFEEVKRFALIMDAAPVFDGHTSNDVLYRLSKIV